MERPIRHTVQATGAAAVVASIAMLPATTGATTDRSAADTAGTAEEHCVIEVVGVERSGEFITEEPVCYETLTEALAGTAPLGTGSRSGDDARSELGGLESVQAASGVIGIHWDGANRTGSSITITGADCAGGYINLSASWTNRISSTRNYCNAVVFWDGFDKTGSWESTGLSSVNLSALNNISNSISYGS